MILRYGKQIQREVWRSNQDKKKMREHLREINERYPGSDDVNYVCPICTGTKTIYFSSIYSYQWRACDNCQSLYVSNPPPEFMLEQLYQETNDFVHIGITDEAKLIFRAMDIWEPKVVFAKDCMEEVGDTWLDVGCGVGELASCARKHGWDVTAVDPNPAVAEIAKGAFDIDVLQGSLDFELPRMLKETYDVVSMINLLEHMPDPIMGMKVARKLVKQGGHLVLEVPHFPCITAYMYGTFPEMTSRVITAPYHLFLFSVKALGAMLNDHGFKATGMWQFGNDFSEMTDLIDTLGEKGRTFSVLFTELTDSFQKAIDEQVMSECTLIVARRLG